MTEQAPSATLHKMHVAENWRDRFARTTDLKLNLFELQTPHFLTLIKSPKEFSILNDLTTYNSGEHLGGCVIRLFDAPNIIGDRYKNRNQLRLDLPNRLAEESFLNYIKNYPIIIDPATEYTFYLSELPKWITDKNEAIHRKIRFFAQKVVAAKKQGAESFSKWKSLENWTLWNRDVANSPRLQHDLIENFYDLELSYGSASLLTPGPLIKDAHDLKTAIDLNELGRVDAEGYDAEFGNYFILSGEAILDRKLKDTLVNFLGSSLVRLNVLKSKFLNLRNASPEMLTEYSDLYRRLAEIREQKKEKVFFALEAGGQAFVSAAVAFDLVSTSMTGVDRHPRGKARRGAGGIFISKELTQIKFDTYKEAYVNNGEIPLCDHQPCKGIDPRQLEKSPPALYAYRRRHYVLSMNDLLTRIAYYVRNQSIEQVTQDLINSHMSPLKKLVPTTWEPTQETIYQDRVPSKG